MPVAAHKIAIIEDDQIISQMYQMKFAADGFTVQGAANGKLGMQLVQHMQPDIILLDVRMPVMDGLTALTKIRAEKWGATIPVLVLTNVGDETLLHQMQTLGISAFLIKADLTPSQVMQRVKEILGLPTSTVKTPEHV